MDDDIKERMDDLESMIAPWIWGGKEDDLDFDIEEHSREVIVRLIMTAYYLWTSIGEPDDVHIPCEATETPVGLDRKDGTTRIGKQLEVKTRSVADFFSLIEL
ncbi:MAG: hypothetical protein V3W52_03445 [Syntrophobacteria bacterium]|jgi:hypothetical protein